MSQSSQNAKNLPDSSETELGFVVKAQAARNSGQLTLTAYQLAVTITSGLVFEAYRLHSCYIFLCVKKRGQYRSLVKMGGSIEKQRQLTYHEEIASFRVIERNGS